MTNYPGADFTRNLTLWYYVGNTLFVKAVNTFSWGFKAMEVCYVNENKTTQIEIPLSRQKTYFCTTKYMCLRLISSITHNYVQQYYKTLI